MTRSISILSLGALLLGGCAKSVIPLYEAAREQALSKPPPAGSDWSPDAVMQISGSALEPLIAEFLSDQGTFSEKIDLKIGSVTPKLTLEQLSLRGSKKCTGCVRVDAELSGSLRWVTPIASGREDLGASLSFDAVAEAVEAQGRWSIQMAPRNLRQVQVDVAGKKLSYAEVPVREWIDRTLLSEMTPRTVADLGEATLPLRAVRVDAVGTTLQLELLSQSPTPTAVEVEPTPLSQGWRLTIATDTLTDLAAAAAFENGEVGYAVVPVPTAFSMVSEEVFALDLRLWRTQGRGWWRDYRITGTAQVRDRRLRLEPTEVEEAGQSPGADWVDPLAMIGEGVILNTLEKALTTTLPSRHRTELGGVSTTAHILDIRPSSSSIVVSGDLTLAEKEKSPAAPRRGGR